LRQKQKKKKSLHPLAAVCGRHGSAVGRTRMRWTVSFSAFERARGIRPGRPPYGLIAYFPRPLGPATRSKTFSASSPRSPPGLAIVVGRGNSCTASPPAAEWRRRQESLPLRTRAKPFTRRRLAAALGQAPTRLAAQAAGCRGADARPHVREAARARSSRVRARSARATPPVRPVRFPAQAPPRRPRSDTRTSRRLVGAGQRASQAVRSRRSTTRVRSAALQLRLDRPIFAQSRNAPPRGLLQVFWFSAPS